MKKAIRLTESQLQQLIKESVNEILKKKSPLHYWTKDTTCPECGKKKGSAMYGGLCPDCAKAKNKVQSMKGFNEEALRKIVKESVRGMLNELDPRTYASYAAKRQAQGQTDKAQQGRQAAVDAFNKQYGYYNRRTPNGFVQKGYVPGYESNSYHMRQEFGDDGNYNGNYYTRAWKSQNYPGTNDMKDTETYSEYHPSTNQTTNQTYRGNLKYNTVGTKMRGTSWNEPEYGDYKNSNLIDTNHDPTYRDGDRIAQQMQNGSGKYIKGKGWQ